MAEGVAKNIYIKLWYVSITDTFIKSNELNKVYLIIQNFHEKDIINPKYVYKSYFIKYFIYLCWVCKVWSSKLTKKKFSKITDLKSHPIVF